MLHFKHLLLALSLSLMAAESRAGSLSTFSRYLHMPPVDCDQIASPPISPDPATVKSGLAASRLAFFQELARSMAEQGFTCCADPYPTGAPGAAGCKELVSRNEGMVCAGRLEGYPQPVAITIPPSYIVHDHADFSLFLHGSFLGETSLPYVLGRTQASHHFVASGRNELMVTPLGHCVKSAVNNRACPDFDAFLAQPANFQNLVSRVGALSKSTGLARDSETRSITMMAHSHGFMAAGAIVRGEAPCVPKGGSQDPKHPLPECGPNAVANLDPVKPPPAYLSKIREAYCFDCLYDRDEHHGQLFMPLIDRPNTRFWNVTTASNGTSEASGLLQKELKSRNLDTFEGCPADTLPGPYSKPVDMAWNATCAPGPALPTKSQILNHRFGTIYHPATTGKPHFDALNYMEQLLDKGE